jgi:hypothetical protein
MSASISACHPDEASLHTAGPPASRLVSAAGRDETDVPSLLGQVPLNERVGTTSHWDQSTVRLWTASARSIVVASATIQRSEPRTAAPGITWPTAVAILDSDGVHLTDVDVPGPPRSGRLLFGDIDEPAALLDYCFGHSDRQVMLFLHDVLVDGWLETRWEGGRRS